MVEIEHAGHPVEAEAVDPVFVEPEAAVGEQEVQDLDLAVVEAARVPGTVPAARPAVEVLMQGPVEAAQALDLVGYGVGVHQVHDHGDPRAVGGIHQRLQVVRGPEARAGGEKIRHLVAEGAVIRVLLNGHELDGVVSGRGDARQYLLGELAPGPDFLLGLSHSEMDFVDERCDGLAPEARVAPREGCFRAPDLGVEDEGGRVLHNPPGPGRDAVALAVLPVELQAVEIAVAQGFFGEPQLPDPLGVRALELEERLFVPSGRISDEEEAGGVRGPFPQHPLVPLQVQPEVLMPRGEIGQGQPAARQAFLRRVDETEPAADAVGIGLKNRVAVNHALDDSLNGQGWGARWMGHGRL